MAKFFGTIIIAVLIFCIQRTDTSGICINDNPCLCELSEYSSLDITYATHNKKNNNTFVEDTDPSGITFYFYGCSDGHFDPAAHHINSTTKLTGSLIRSNETFAEVLGSSSDIHFEAVKDVKDTYQLIYSHGEKVIANVYLMCENLDQPYIKVLSNKDEPVVLAFNTPSACIQTHRHGLSGGSVLLIIFFIAFGVYFVGGIAILYFMRGARGLEAIPNIDFWRGLPGLVKDGLIFLFSGCNASSITTPETYDRI